MYLLNVICILLLITGGIHAAPFLWPSSLSRGTTTPPSGPPHPHAHLGHPGSFTPIMGQPYISHLQHMQHEPNLASRPLPPLVIGAHYHQHHHPITGVAHLQGGIHHSHHRRQHNYHLTHPLARHA